DIVFTLERKDGQEFEYKDGDQVKHEKRINLVTNAEGIANVKGLRQGEYVVKEIIAPDWIVLDASKPIVREFTVSDRDTKGTELKIENEKKTTQIKVSKRWVDSAGKDLNDYPNIEVQLYRNDEPINKVTLEKGKLEHTWDNLEIADDTGKLYEYRVKEVNEENQSIKIDERWYSVNYEKDVNKGFVITNKQVPPLTPLVPPTRDIKVTKDWKDTKGDKANAPVEKIKVQLFKDGVKEGKEKELTKENGWETTFEKLPVSEKVGSKNYEYTVKEVDDLGRMIENDGNISFNNKWYKVKITGSMKDGFIIENKEENPWTPMIPPTRDIKVTKDWKDTKGDKVNAPVEKIKVQLFKDGVKEGEAKEITSANGWKVTFEDLKVSEKVGSKNYEYTVKEVDDVGNIIEDGGEIKFSGNSYKVSIKGNMKDGFTITNTEKPSKPITPLTPAKTSLKVEKEWKGIESKDAPEVTVYLVKNKVKTDKFIKLNKDNNWQGEFKDLDVVDNIKDAQANKYTVVEDGEKDGKVVIGDTEYKVTYVGGKVVNTKVTPQIPQHPLVPGKTSLKVEKEWKGIDSKEAPEVTIYLVKNGVKTNKFIKLNKNNNWQGEFTNLDVVDDIKDKKANVYTIVEDGEINGKIVLDGKEYKVTYVGGKVVNTKVEKPVKPEQPKDPQKPVEPKKPETPGKKTPDSPKSNTPKNLPKTGDNSNIGLYTGLAILSGCLLALVTKKRKSMTK
ncbi:TPA: Cna B-type domain-containing protein, partial [Streptococcus equi subsp. zooepidemicus]|nr:Cna B-type domain-containing protein [Streptococcus equi subsp. zooepidemicus]